MSRSQSSSASLLQLSNASRQAHVSSPKQQSESSQSSDMSQSSSNPLTHRFISESVQPQAGVPMQSASLQSTVVSQSSSSPLVQFSPAGSGVQPQLGTSSQAGSKQSATPLQSLSSASKQFSSRPGWVLGLRSLQSSPPHCRGAWPSPSSSRGSLMHMPSMQRPAEQGSPGHCWSTSHSGGEAGDIGHHRIGGGGRRQGGGCRRRGTDGVRAVPRAAGALGLEITVGTGLVGDREVRPPAPGSDEQAQERAPEAPHSCRAYRISA